MHAWRIIYAYGEQFSPHAKNNGEKQWQEGVFQSLREKSRFQAVL
jgi:hypothetical protein